MQVVMYSDGVTTGSGDEGGKKRQGGRQESKGSNLKQPCSTHHEFHKTTQVIAYHTDSKASMVIAGSYHKARVHVSNGTKARIIRHVHT